MRLRSYNVGRSAKFNGRLRSLRNRKKVEERSPEPQQSPPLSDEEVPTTTRRPPVVKGRGRKRRSVFEDGEGPAAMPESQDPDFKTPVRARQHRLRGLSDMDPGYAVRSIYSPIVRFLTPTKENCRPPSGGDVLMSPEQCVFGFGSVSLLQGEEDTDDVFSPFSFIKNVPEQPQQSSHSARDIPPKTRSTPPATLILDLDETIMYSSLSVIEDAEYTFHTSFQDNQYKVYMILRPYVKDFLQAMAKVFEIFVYTSAKKEYAEKILNILDPKRKLFRHRLYQEDCVCVLGHYVKDLGVLNRDLAKTVVLDNAPHTYPYHLMNLLPIKSWSGDEEDTELKRLIPYLERLAAADDFRSVLKRRTDHIHRLLTED